ncbi:MAG: hypothetical protein JWL63_2676 [Rhodocyclales bacterium]|nr:hypothetical protein [Rhodocyclales bacterium]
MASKIGVFEIGSPLIDPILETSFFIIVQQRNCCVLRFERDIIPIDKGAQTAQSLKRCWPLTVRDNWKAGGELLCRNLGDHRAVGANSREPIKLGSIAQVAEFLAR